MPKVSVIMPTYNRAETLPDALESLLAQTYLDFEVIVVDDGSTDNTRAVVEEYCKKDSRIIYYYQENKERSAARNQGIRLSRDLPEKLEKQVTILDSVRDSDFVYCHYKSMDRMGNPVESGDSPAYALSGNIYPELMRFTGANITTPSVMVRKKIFDKIGGFDEKMNVCEDLDLWRRAARVTRVEQMQEALIAIREGAGSAARKYLWQGYKGVRIYYRKAINEDRNLGFYFKMLLCVELYVVYGKIGVSNREWLFSAYMFFRLLLIAPVAPRQLVELYMRHRRKLRMKKENTSFGRL